MLRKLSLKMLFSLDNFLYYVSKMSSMETFYMDLNLIYVYSAREVVLLTLMNPSYYQCVVRNKYPLFWFFSISSTLVGTFSTLLHEQYMNVYIY